MIARSDIINTRNEYCARKLVRNDISQSDMELYY